MQEFNLRAGTLNDISELRKLYKLVAGTGSLGRQANEITEEYITDFVTQSLAKGLIFVLHPVNDPQIIIGEIHGYPLGLKTFAHVFEQVTMAVNPDYQGQGLGKSLLQHVQTQIMQYHPEIMKIELKCFSNNKRAVQLYLTNGFIIEGYHKSRVNLKNGQFADGISLGWFNPTYLLNK